MLPLCSHKYCCISGGPFLLELMVSQIYYFSHNDNNNNNNNNNLLFFQKKKWFLNYYLHLETTIIVRALNRQKYMLTYHIEGQFRFMFILCFKPSKYISVCWTCSDFLWGPANMYWFKFSDKAIVKKR